MPRVSSRVMVRVSRRTHAALLQLIQDITEAYQLGRIQQWWPGEDLTMADMVGRLVDLELAHRLRSRQSSKARTERERKKREALADMEARAHEYDVGETPEEVP